MPPTLPVGGNPTGVGNLMQAKVHELRERLPIPYKKKDAGASPRNVALDKDFPKLLNQTLRELPSLNPGGHLIYAALLIES
jgi:hypothetical protein